ncbi:MAG: DUF4276 family protein [Endomicrobium sp.]|jgi:hypothetical protein|nr:DUF4276 family protein [Endomicrobium sp.]
MTSKFVNVSIICEGQTEVDFVKNKLNKTYFNSKNIFLKPILLKGDVSIDKIVTFAKRASHPIVTTLVDFYGFKNKGDKTVSEIEKALFLKVNKEYFIPYLQLHETEALWFSDIVAIVNAKNASDKQKEFLNAIIKQYKNPEDINDSVETAPSKRLENIFKDYEKITDGNRIFEKISVESMKTKCPRFKQWLETVETTADKLRK